MFREVEGLVGEQASGEKLLACCHTGLQKSSTRFIHGTMEDLQNSLYFS